MNNYYEFLTAMLSITLSMSTVITVLLFVRSFMKKRFTASCRFIIWTLVILRLCIPVGGIFMPSMISVSVFEEEAEKAEAAKEVTFTESTETFIIPERTQVSHAVTDITTETLPPISPAMTEEESAKPSLVITPEIIVNLFLLLWIAGAALFIAVCLTRYCISARRIRRASFDAPEKILELYKELCEKMSVRKAPHLAISHFVTSPMLYGYFSPTIVLPAIDLKEAALTGVLSHELTHYKRKDLYLKFIAMLANALNWANPFVYAAVKAFYSEMELSCDEKVLSGCDDSVRVTYGQVMLDIIKHCYGTSEMLTTGFNPASNAVKERFINILDSKKKKRGSAIISVVLALCMISGSLLGIEAAAAAYPEAETEKEEDTVDIVISEETLELTPETHPIPIETAAQETEIMTEAQTETEPARTTPLQEFESIVPEIETIIYESTSILSPETSAETKPPKTEVIPAETKKPEPIHTHTYTKTIVAPSCSAMGYTTNICSCGYSTITDVVSPTYNHALEYATITVTVENEDAEYVAYVCRDCGVEVNFKKNVWDGTSIKYMITGPFLYEGEYNPDGELVIYGSGEMCDYASFEDYFTEESAVSLPAWWLYGSMFDSIVIADKITSIGANSFNNIAPYVNTVKIGKDVKYIGKNAFAGSTELKTLYLPRGIEKIEAGAFAGATNITIKFEGSYEEFMQIDLGNLDYSNVELNTKY